MFRLLCNFLLYNMIYTAIRILIAGLFSMSSRSTVASSSATYDLCDVGKITEENFTITLNLSENVMPNRLECSQVIFLQSKRVKLALEKISIDSGAVFEIHDGPYARMQHIGPTNVTSSPSVYVSSGNAMFLRFTRSESARGTSFIRGKITSEPYQTTCHCRGVKNGQLECAEIYGERKCEVHCQPSFMDLFTPKELRCDLFKGKWNINIHNMSLSCQKARSPQMVEVVVRFKYANGTCQDFDLTKVEKPFLQYLTNSSDVKRRGVCFRADGLDKCSVKRLDVRCGNFTPPQITVTITDQLAAPSNFQDGSSKFLDLFNVYSKGVNLQGVADSEELRITEGNATFVVDKSSFVVDNASPLCNDTLFYIKPHGTFNYPMCSSCPVHHVYNSTTQTCQECPPGSFAPEGAVSCVQGEDEGTKIAPIKTPCSNKCMKGKQVDANSWMCEWCPYDSYQDDSTMLDPKCKSCPDKKKTPFPGAQNVTECFDPCHSGTFLNMTSGQCQECQVGTYLEFEEHAYLTCRGCPSGRTTLSLGSKTENACIVLCGKGQFHNTSKGTCQECPKDTYQDQNHHTSTTCKPCGPNKITKKPGQINISQCQAYSCQKGWFSDKSAECKKCPKGFYQDQQGQNQCKQCSDGTSTIDEGQLDALSCIRTCSRGEFLDAKHKTCNACPYGSYQEADSHLQTECNWCPGRVTAVNEGAQNSSSCFGKCSNFPCQNGATCTESGNSLKCTCPAGVSGTFCDKIENIDKFHNIKMSLSFTSLSWSEELKDQTSLKFRKTKNQIEGAIRYVFRYDPSFKAVQVTDFANGSVVANFDLYFNDDADYVPAKALQTAAHLGKVQNVSVLPDSLKILHQDCKQPLGIENNRVTDNQISASTHFKNYEPYEGRLNAKGGRGWEAKYLRRQEYLQIDFEKQVNITAVATQGRPPGFFVTEYKLSFSDDTITWMEYTEGSQSKTFKGNEDSNRVERNNLQSPVSARLIRFLPQSWNGSISMRVEVYGCLSDPLLPSAEKPTDGSTSPPDVGAVKKDKRGNWGVYLGIAFGVFLVVGVVIAVLCWRRRSRQKETATTTVNESLMPMKHHSDREYQVIKKGAHAPHDYDENTV